MKVCISELLKTVKEYENKVSQLNQLRRESSSVTYSKEETPIEPEYSVETLTCQIENYRTEIRKLRQLIAKLNLETVSEVTSMSLAETITYLGQISSEISSFEGFERMQPKSRRTSGLRGEVEFTEIRFDKEWVKEKVEYLKTWKNRLQMEIDRLNLNTFTETELKY